MRDYFNYSQLNCRLDDDVNATTPSFGHKTEADVFDIDRGYIFCIEYWNDVPYLTSPQNSVIPFFAIHALH